MTLTPVQVVAILYPQLVAGGEMEVAKEIQTVAPKAIEYLESLEKEHPGFLHILADVEGTVVDALEVAVDWADEINPPAASTNGTGTASTESEAFEAKETATSTATAETSTASAAPATESESEEETAE